MLPSAPVDSPNPAPAAIHTLIAAVRRRQGSSCANLAWALYTRSQAQPGGIYLTDDEIRSLCNVATWDAARRLLAKLEDTGFISYFTSRGHAVHVLVHAVTTKASCGDPTPWANPPQSGRTDPIPYLSPPANTPPTQPDQPPMDHSSRIAGQTGCNPAALPELDDTVSQSVFSSPLPSLNSNLPTQVRTHELEPQACPGDAAPGPNPPVPNHAVPTTLATAAADATEPLQPTFSYAWPGTPERKLESERSYRLLTDDEVGLFHETAIEFAIKHKFDWLLAQVCTWRRDVEFGGIRLPGALVKRIKTPFRCRFEAVDFDTPLYRRHMPEESSDSARSRKEEEARRHKYIPPEYADIIIG